MSLKDRLTRRNGGAPAAAVPVVIPATPAAERPAVMRGTGPAVTSGMYGRRIEEEVLSAVDRVKIDLHRRLIERLNLEALEQLSDERVINAEIRAVVAELLREEPTPLTVADREGI